MIIGLAPMDWFTDCAMRDVTQEIFDKYSNASLLDKGGVRVDLFLRTEFMTADGYCAKPQAVIRHLMTSPIQKNLIAQIHGGNIKTLLKTVKDINKKYAKDFIGIELNLGCPAHNIMKSGGGSELLRCKEETLKIIEALSNASKLPFSIKTRTGLDQKDRENQTEFLVKASKFCSMITIHGRTVKQAYTGEADREFIYNLKKLVDKKCKIIGNWWIHSYEEAKARLGNLDGVMIGLAAIGNPRIFTPYVQTFWQKVSLKEKRDTIIKHLDLMLKYNSDQSEERIVIEFRKHLSQYIKWIPDSREFKVKMSEIKNQKDLISKVEKFLN